MTHDETRAMPAAHGERGEPIVVLVRDASGAVVHRTPLDRELWVGTSDSCDVVVQDATVSRRHLRVSAAANGARVRDEGSRNGTWLDEVRLHDAEVGVGDVVRIGSSTLEFERTASAPSTPASVRTTKATKARCSSMGRFRGEAPELDRLYAQLERAVPTDATVLLEGESGTGKELLAEAVHDLSPRKDAPFVVVDCGSVPENLIESELFGHERGAFTGADRARVGAFESAHRGTIFLDEIGELPLAMQTRLLRVLDRKQLRRVGSQKTIDVDVRVVAATNRNLEREVEEGRFRLDLFHRLAVVLVRVPPLRERASDIALLARHFVENAGGKPDEVLTPEVQQRLERHSWPGNSRELRNHIERLVLLGDAPLGPATATTTSELSTLAASGLPYRVARTRMLEAFTDAYVQAMLDRHGGNVSQAARAAGVARRHFQRLKQRDDVE